eukprot:CAMPEP_0174822852 /NCGR_PEP_ID=MMETSP1107-20130205/19125_1 /TAXON_ID=36770 /ORGANISM="Paraphysomonas vestita, Strain GFlagA" /LENGTH=248 /DNA_ID=CAMNT_0016043101 /DNA_START=517 /DNA_END=1263 /DNA_ORIENTATION=-
MTGEILALNSEITSLKEDLKRALEGKYQNENTISTKTRETEQLEREVSRLRREVALGLNISQRGSLTSLSIDEDGSIHQGLNTLNSDGLFQTNSTVSRRGNDVISSTSTPFSTSLINQKYSSTPSGASPQSRPITQLSRSLNSSSSSSILNPTDLQGKRFNRQPFTNLSSTSPMDSQYLSAIPSSPNERQKEEKVLTSGDAMAVGPKSRYTGSGLGLRKSEVPEFNPKGSAKSVLKRILKEQQEKEKN